MASAAVAPAPVLTPVMGLPPPDSSLPALEPAKNREQYRERPEAETEEAVWFSPEEPDTLVEPEQVRLRSIHSKQAAVIVFANKSRHRVRALWVDFKGNEVAYSILEPGHTKRYHTYVTHPWIIRELHSATRMMLSGRPAVVGLSTEQTVEIQEPPVLSWNLTTHAAFPESYKSSVRSLLLSHKALEPHAAATHGPASPDALAARSVLQSPKKRTAMSPRRGPSYTSTIDMPCPSPSKRKCSASPRTSMPPLSPAGPKAYSAAATPRNSTTTTSISISSEAAHFRATLTVSSPRRANLKSTVNIELAGAGGSNRTTVNFDTFLTDVEDDQLQQRDVAVPAPGSIDQLLPGLAAATVRSAGSSSSQAPDPAKKLSRNLFSMLKLCTSPATASPRNMLKNLLSRPSLSHSGSKVVSFDPTISGPCAAPPAGRGLDVKVKPVHAAASTSLKVEVQQCDDMLVDDVSDADACWPPTDTHLGNLPSHLLVYIAELAAPKTWQSLAAVPLGRPDIKPTLLACKPISAEEQQQLEEQQQQAEQQQNGNNQQ